MSLRVINNHLAAIRRCRLCRDMAGKPVVGRPVHSPIILVGQAPGVREEEFDRPFAWTAGRTLFSWFQTLGLSEDDVRSKIYFAAVCRCFPGKSAKGGGDRVPTPTEIKACSAWLSKELTILNPQLIIPVGKLAIAQFLSDDLLKEKKLDQIIGRSFQFAHGRRLVDVIPLPHPSGASPWHRIEPGKTLLKKALRQIAAHSAVASLI